MGIVITKKGNKVDSHKVDVVCNKCECEFTCDNTDFEGGVIECPNCKKNISYQDTLTYKNNVVEYKNNIEEIKRKIKKEVFEGIDFKKIHNYMVNANWIWSSSRNVPTIYEIKENLEKLIYEAIDRKATISTGGFIVRYNEYQEDECGPHTIGVDVVFYVTTTSSDVNVNTLEYVYY